MGGARAGINIKYNFNNHQLHSIVFNLLTNNLSLLKLVS